MSVTSALHASHIHGTERKAIVQSVQILLCQLTAAVSKGIGLTCKRVYINTRVMKHVYDKRPAQEYDFLVENLGTIVKYPDRVYKNKDGKRGEYVFVKFYKNTFSLASIVVVNKESDDTQCEIVTFFTIDEDYLSDYKLLWEWKDGAPSS